MVLVSSFSPYSKMGQLAEGQKPSQAVYFNGRRAIIASLCTQLDARQNQRIREQMPQQRERSPILSRAAQKGYAFRSILCGALGCWAHFNISAELQMVSWQRLTPSSRFVGCTLTASRVVSLEGSLDHNGLHFRGCFEGT